MKAKVKYCKCGCGNVVKQYKSTDNYFSYECKRRDNGMTTIKKQSDKRLVQNSSYLLLRQAFLRKYPKCEARLAGCTHEAKTIHHSKGRIGELLTDMTHWKGLCMNCHHWVEMHPEQAKELNLSKSRLAK